MTDVIKISERIRKHNERKPKVTPRIARFEVIDATGRAYIAKDCKIDLSYQDDGRTLKVFVKPLT